MRSPGPEHLVGWTAEGSCANETLRAARESIRTVIDDSRKDRRSHAIDPVTSVNICQKPWAARQAHTKQGAHLIQPLVVVTPAQVITAPCHSVWSPALNIFVVEYVVATW